MNRIIFQFGLLGFCMSVVLFGLEGFKAFDAILRAFVVFVAVVIAGTALLGAASWIAVGPKNSQDIAEESASGAEQKKDAGAVRS